MVHRRRRVLLVRHPKQLRIPAVPVVPAAQDDIILPIPPSLTPSQKHESSSTAASQGETTSSNERYPWIPQAHSDKIAAFVITIRPNRYRNFLNRMGPWARSHVHKIDGVNGSKLNPARLAKEGTLCSSAHRIANRRGRIGCYLSHMMAWRRFLKTDAQVGLIFEDDVALRINSGQESRFKNAVNTLMSVGPNAWDVVHLCHYPRGQRGIRPQKSELGPGFSRVHTWHVLYGYAISRAGAKALLASALPISAPVDVHIGRLASKGRLRVHRLDKPICKSVPAGSDTEWIR